MLIKKHSYLILAVFCLLLPQITTAKEHLKINLILKNASINQATKAIEKQTLYTFIYDNTVTFSNPVSITLKNASLEDALYKIFGTHGISYEISKQQIVLTQRNTVSNQKVCSIQGAIFDKGGPIIGAIVQVKGSDNRIVTDLDGQFMLTGVPVTAKIQISYIGYRVLVLPASSDFSKVMLIEDSEALDEVVITALGIKRSEKALAYNVQQVNSDEINSVKDANFINSLVGKVAGVSIQSSASGMGGTTKIVMRGSKSLTKNNNALYVIDGIPMSNVSSSGEAGFMTSSIVGSESSADINPEDIESVSMLTGPSAAALYGYEGANGVVLITTKKGSDTEGKVKIAVSNSTMFSHVNNLYDMQNTYGNLSNQFQSWGTKLETPSNYHPKDFFKTGVNLINSITLTTGTKKNQTFVSGSTTNSVGKIPNSKYNRYNLNVRNTSRFGADKFTLDIGFNYIKQSNVNMIGQGLYFNPLHAVYLFPRGENFDAVRMFERYDQSRGISTQYWPYGDQGMALQNPYWTMKRMVNKNNKNRYMLNASLSYQILDWLNIKGRAKIDNTHYLMTDKKYASTARLFTGQNGGYKEKVNLNYSTYADFLVNMDKDITPDFNISANIGASYTDLLRQGLNAGVGLGNIPNLFTFQNIKSENRYGVLHNKLRHQTQSVFANFEMSYKRSYYLTLTGRNDWDSNLAYSDQSSFFYPSIGGSVVISEILHLPSWISFAKVRASHAEVAMAFDHYLSNPYYPYDASGSSFKTSTRLPAKHLKPEKSISTEFGLNFCFFNDLKLDATYYKSNTKNQSFNIALAPSSGYTSALVQAGNVENRGWEIALGYSHKWNDFSWNSSVTYTSNRNKIIRLANGALNPITLEPIEMDQVSVATLGKAGSGAEVILTEGRSMGELYVRKGLMQDGNGDIFVDKNGNVSIEDYKNPKHIGSLDPKYNIGFSNRFSYKGLNLNVVLSARVGGLVTSVTEGILDFYGVSQATADARDAGGVIVNSFNAPIEAKKYYQAIGGAEGGLAQYYMYDATNVRLQELNLSYSFPKQWFANKMKLTAGIIGRNLWMIYCKAPFDPELSAATSSSFYRGVDYFMQPSMRNIGFNVKFEF